MIYHIPLKIDKALHSASQIRPMKMIEAFKSIGYDIDLVEGNAKERKKKIKVIKENIKKGVKYDFLYSESSTMPTLLTEKHHIPLFPFLDFSFFSYCKKHKIKIGLFYRDIYWCFDNYDTSINRKIAKWFYKYDLRKYQELVDVLFVPSLEMLSYLPTQLNIRSYELPSGCIIAEAKKGMVNNDKLEFLYVGGIGEHYDLSLFLQVIKNKQCHFTLCCRENDWNKVKSKYERFIGDNVSVVHKSGEELNHLYNKADIFCLFVEPNEYREFAVPYKLFETIGRKCPILASKGTWVGNYVEKHKIGFVCDYDYSKLSNMIESMTNYQLECYRNNIGLHAESNTWESRCNFVKSLLI